MAGVEVISGVERRRHWSTDQKRADVNSGQIYRWRDELRGVSGRFSREAGFAQVTVGNGGQVRMPAICSCFGASAGSP